jgi:hypothetical protein
MTEVRKNHLLSFSILLNVNEQDVRGRSVLHCLLMKDLFSDLKEIKMGIQMLLKYGADVNIKDKCKEDTPLHVVGLYPFY